MDLINCILFLLMLATPGERLATAALPAGPPTIEISAADSAISLGDSVSIRCTVTIPTGVEVAEPRLREENSSFEIERRIDSMEKTASGRVQRYEYLIYVFSPDSVRVGPFITPYVTANGDSGVAVSNILDFTVAGFMENPEAPPKPSRDPLEIKGGGFPVWGWVLIAAALVAALAIYMILRRKKKPVPAVIIERSLDEIGEFEHIRALHLKESGQIKELYAQVSGAMRGFLHRNMGFDALYSTTEEIRRKLSRTWKDRESADAIRVIFEESDMVKFAKYTPPEELSSTVIDRAIIPVRRALDVIAEESERARVAEEERRRASAPTAAGQTAPAGGEKEEGSR
jgi:hypothetical protein